MEVIVKKPTKIEVGIISVMGKVRDSGTYQLKTPEGNVVHDYEGSVPGFFPGNHYGDYLELNIDLATGRILNWKAPSSSELQEFMEAEDN